MCHPTRRACLLALLVVLTLVVICLAGCRPPGASDGFQPRYDGRNRLWPPLERSWRHGLRLSSEGGSGYYWRRDEWPRPDVAGVPMWWWRYPGYAAPLELSLPFQNYWNYLYDFPPASYMPFNA